jgi:hypothetical protein
MDTTVKRLFRLEFVGPDTSAGQVPAERHGGSDDGICFQSYENLCSLPIYPFNK